jgi:hypothetical protein
MTDTMIQCPHCEGTFPLTETLAQQVVETERQKLQQEMGKRVEDLDRRAASLERTEEQLRLAKEGLDQQVAARLATELTKVRQAEQKKAREEVGTEVQGLRDELASKKSALQAAQDQELALRRAQVQLEQEQAELKLTVQRTVDAERGKIRAEAKQAAADEQRLLLAEKESVIEDMKKKLEAAQRASEKTSQQLQGDVLEADLATTLGRAFPRDEIVRTAKGQNGADIVQRVLGPRDQECGSILWESKRTKNWSDGWLPKLRDDQRAEGADLAVIVSAALPDDLLHFGERDGVWIASPAFAPHLALLLRQQLIEVAQARVAATGQSEKSELLYRYLTGPQFRQRITAIVESFTDMQRELESEQRAFAQRRSKREKQIERMLANTFGLYGDVQGISGAALPELEAAPALPA